MSKVYETDFSKEYPTVLDIKFNVSGSEYSVKHTYNDMTPWPEMLNDFVNLLELAGFIGVRKRLSVEESPFSEGWEGSTHKDTEDDWK